MKVDGRKMDRTGQDNEWVYNKDMEKGSDAGHDTRTLSIISDIENEGGIPRFTPRCCATLKRHRLILLSVMGPKL